MFGSKPVNRERALKPKMAVLGTETACSSTVRRTDATSVRLLLFCRDFKMRKGFAALKSMHDGTSGKAVK